MLDKFERDEGLRHFQRGVALERVNRTLEAVEEYRQAVARYPYLREAHAALGFYYQRNGLLARAADEFRIVANLEGDFLSFFNLGHVLVELECYEEAINAFEYCLKLEPDDPVTHYEIAYIHYACNHPDIALKHLHIPLESYPEDWEVLNLMGKCHLSMGTYDKARSAFEQAIGLAHVPQVEAELLESIATVERYREFRSITSAKDRMYAEDGVVCLGSSRDNGLVVDIAQEYHFTYRDIATTMQRMLALQQANQWECSAVLPVDRMAEPLARAFGTCLHLAPCRWEDLDENDTTLVVMTVAREVELMLLTVERLPCSRLTFCLGVNWLRHSKLLPDITGIAASGPCSVPWESDLRQLCASGSARDAVEACIHDATAQIVQAMQENLPEKNLARQVRYYTRTHRRLSFRCIPGGG